MGNLGPYQKITTVSKIVGGPWNLVGMLIASGVAGTLGVQKAVGHFKKKRSTDEVTYLEDGRIFQVSSAFGDDNGLHLKRGDRYRILSRDKDAVMIEKLGDPNNPYAVSAATLTEISDFDSSL